MMIDQSGWEKIDLIRALSKKQNLAATLYKLHIQLIGLHGLFFLIFVFAVRSIRSLHFLKDDSIFSSH